LAGLACARACPPRRESWESEGPHPSGLVGCGLPSEAEWRKQVVDAYVEWWRPLPVQLWLTVNAREPLGVGGWTYVLRLVHGLVEEAIGHGGLAQTAWLGAIEPNRDRELCHLHALGLGPASMRQPRRVGSGGLIAGIEDLVEPLHASWRPYVQPDNRAAVTLRAVRAFGNGPDSLTRYFTKYAHKDRDAAQIEVGDVARFFRSSQVVLC
jgi:hypothetical protein